MSKSYFEGFGDILTPLIGTGINGIPDPLRPLPQHDLLDLPLAVTFVHCVVCNCVNV